MRWGGLSGSGSVFEYFLLSILEFLQFGVWGLGGFFSSLFFFFFFGCLGKGGKSILMFGVFRFCLLLSIGEGTTEGARDGWTVLLIYTCLLGLLDRYERLCRDERRVREMVYA